MHTVFPPRPVGVLGDDDLVQVVAAGARRVFGVAVSETLDERTQLGQRQEDVLLVDAEPRQLHAADFADTDVHHAAGVRQHLDRLGVVGETVVHQRATGKLSGAQAPP